VWVHICSYLHQVYRCVYAEFACMCAYIYIHVRQIHMWVCIYLHICTRAYKCMHTCLFLYMCVWVYICMFICMWKDTVGAYRCSVCISKYMYTYLGLYVCVYVCTPIHICIKRRRVCIQSVCIKIHTCLCGCLVYRWVLYVCVGICIYACTRERHHGWIQIHCVRIGIHVHVSVFVRGCVCIRMYTHIYEKTPCLYTNLHMCVYILVYIHTDFTCGYVSI